MSKVQCVGVFIYYLFSLSQTSLVFYSLLMKRLSLLLVTMRSDALKWFIGFFLLKYYFSFYFFSRLIYFNILLLGMIDKNRLYIFFALYCVFCFVQHCK